MPIETLAGYTSQVDILHKTFDKQNAFLTEKDMHKFIKGNVNQFAKSILGIELDKFEYEPIIRNKKTYRLQKVGYLTKRHQPRPDFIFYGKNKEIWIVECKNNIRTSAVEGLSQLLLYKYFNQFPIRRTKYLLLCSVFEYIPFEIFENVKIPLKLALLNKTNNAIYG